jgi:tripartite-type tricarboxylate transporter receptor subunit TctC
MRSIRTIAAAAALVVATGSVTWFVTWPAAAQDWPTRPVTMVISFTAGSSIDVAGRIVAARLSELLGQSVIIENIGGAGGMTGAARVAKATPDGYQILFGGSAANTYSQLLYKAPLYNAVTDFAPVAMIADTPPVLITRKDLPPDNLQQFITYAKANHAKMQYGSAGGGSASHLACVLLNSTIGVNLTHVPYRGGPQAMQDLIGGRIDYWCPLAASAIPQIESKTVKAIAMMSKNRAPILPSLASAHEQGLSNFDASSWYGIFAPKATPAPIIQKLHAAIVAALDTPAVQQRMSEVGADVVGPDRRSPDYLQKFVENDIKMWAEIVKAAGITPE